MCYKNTNHSKKESSERLTFGGGGGGGKIKGSSVRHEKNHTHQNKTKNLNNESEDPFTDQQPSTLSDPFSGHIFFGAGPIQ